ncbi:LacI family transcriptional regulator [Paenibacillus sp. FSL H8-457]|nr:LacI family transcriptional regulator [Paenibacillus sp. FSL H8-457]
MRNNIDECLPAQVEFNTREMVLDYVGEGQELIPRLTTIYDIAKKTGYSPTTVSKVFNNYPDVREKTRVKILETAKEMGYLPNANARSLTTKRSWTIGILFVEATGAGIRHPYFGAVIESFKKISVSKGYDLMFISKDVGGRRSSYVEHCKIRGVDGVVVILSSNDDPDFQELLDSGIPCVILDSSPEHVHSVYSDNIGGSMLAIRYLHSLGHRSIAHISGGLNTFAGEQRQHGYETALRELDLNLREEYITGSDFYSTESGYEAMKRLLALADRPTAVYAAGDLLALGAIRAVLDHGLSVPGDVSVIGFDDIEMSRYITPALTTVRQDTEQLGKVAAEILLSSIEERDTAVKSVMLPVELMIRESCRPVT